MNKTFTQDRRVPTDTEDKVRTYLRQYVSENYGVQEIVEDNTVKYKCYVGLGGPADKSVFYVHKDELTRFFDFLEHYDNAKVFKHLWSFYQN